MTQAIADNGVQVLEQTKLAPPSMWNVVIHNDDKTPMEFVIIVLMQIFHKDAQSATELMLRVHDSGKGVAGTFTKEIATDKKAQTDELSKINSYPLKTTLEPN
jgi:ATP-dependent Clp protease adaptor protein ClpS